MKRWPWIIGASVIVVLLSLGFFLPSLKVQSVTVEGAHFVTQDDIDAVKQQWVNKPAWWLVMTGQASRWLVDTYPQIRTVNTKMKTINGIHITLEEKRPLASFWVSNKSLLVSIDGTVLNRKSEVGSPKSGVDLLIVRGLPSESVANGNVPAQTMSVLTQLIIALHDYLPRHTFQVEFKDTVYEDGQVSMRKMVLLKDDQLPIFMDPNLSIENAIKNLSGFLKNFDGDYNTIKTIDLRVSDRIIVTHG